MAKRLRRQRRRIHIEDGGEARPVFCISKESDPFGDLVLPAYDAVRNLTESGALPVLFSDFPESTAAGGSSVHSSHSAEVAATMTSVVVRPII